MLSLMVHQVGAFWGQFAPTSPPPVRSIRGALDQLDQVDKRLSRAHPNQDESGDLE